jgi:hypothetical protein
MQEWSAICINCDSVVKTDNSLSFVNETVLQCSKNMDYSTRLWKRTDVKTPAAVQMIGVGYHPDRRKIDDPVCGV